MHSRTRKEDVKKQSPSDSAYQIKPQNRKNLWTWRFYGFLKLWYRELPHCFSYCLTHWSVVCSQLMKKLTRKTQKYVLRLTTWTRRTAETSFSTCRHTYGCTLARIRFDNSIRCNTNRNPKTPAVTNSCHNGMMGNSNPVKAWLFMTVNPNPDMWLSEHAAAYIFEFMLSQAQLAADEISQSRLNILSVIFKWGIIDPGSQVEEKSMELGYSECTPHTAKRCMNIYGRRAIRRQMNPGFQRNKP